MLCRDILNALSNVSGDQTDRVSLETVIENMTLHAYNLKAVVPVILDDYLLPNRLVDASSNGMKITPYGRKILQKINQPDVSLDDIISVIEAGGGEQEDLSGVIAVVRELISELQEIHRPRVFFDIVPDRRANMLNVVLRNSGKSPAFNVTCNLDPDLPYYDDVSLSSLSVFKDLPFLESGREIAFYFNSLPSIINDKDFAKQIRVKLVYFDSRNRRYSENYSVSLERFKGILLSEFADMTDIHNDLNNIRRQLENIQRRGILTKTTGDIKKEAEQFKKKLDMK
jgi:hypothetical protein